MVAEANRGGLVSRSKHLLKKGFDRLLVLLHEFLLAATDIDDQADAERKLVVMRKEADLLWHTIFNDLEVVLGQPRHNAALRIVDAERGVDQMCLHLDHRDVLGLGKHGQKEGSSREEKQACCTEAHQDSLALRMTGIRSPWRAGSDAVTAGRLNCSANATEGHVT